jgi:hypothetical protein
MGPAAPTAAAETTATTTLLFTTIADMASTETLTGEGAAFTIGIYVKHCDQESGTRTTETRTKQCGDASAPSTMSGTCMATPGLKLFAYLDAKQSGHEKAGLTVSISLSHTNTDRGVFSRQHNNRRRCQ